MHDMTHYIPAMIRERVHRLGQSNWCGFVQDDSGKGTHFRIDLAALAAADPSGVLKDHFSCIDVVSRRALVDADHQGDRVLFLYMVAKALATGPGLLALDARTCRTLCRVKITAPPAAFTMPRPTLIVDFAPEWCNELGLARSGMRYVMVTYETAPACVFVLCTTASGCRFGKWNAGVMSGDQALEDYLCCDSGDPSGSWYDALLRVALNAALLTHVVGLDQVGWCDPEAHAAHGRMTAARDPELRAQGAYLAGIDIRRYKFLRDVMPLVRDDGHGPPFWRHRVGPDGKPRPYLDRPRARVRGRFTGPEV